MSCVTESLTAQTWLNTRYWKGDRGSAVRAGCGDSPRGRLPLCDEVPVAVLHPDRETRGQQNATSRGLELVSTTEQVGPHHAVLLLPLREGSTCSVGVSPRRVYLGISPPALLPSEGTDLCTCSNPSSPSAPAGRADDQISLLFNAPLLVRWPARGGSCDILQQQTCVSLAVSEAGRLFLRVS